MMKKQERSLKNYLKYVYSHSNKVKFVELKQNVIPACARPFSVSHKLTKLIKIRYNIEELNLIINLVLRVWNYQEGQYNFICVWLYRSVQACG